MATLVNGHRIEDGEIEREAQYLSRHLSTEEQQALSVMPQNVARLRLLEQARQQAIERVLLRQEAGKRGFEPEHGTVKRAIAQAEERYFKGDNAVPDEIRQRLHADILAGEQVRLLIDSIVEAIPPVSEAEALAFYEEHAEQFTRPEKVRAAHIVAHGEESDAESMAAARTKIEAAREALGAGETFAAVAGTYSDCPSKGGDLGLFARGEMVQRFEDVVFELEPGQVSEPFVTEFGWHIAMVQEREQAEVLAFASVAEDLRAYLGREQQQQAMQKYIQDLRAGAKIERVD